MKKSILVTFLTLILLLSACAPATYSGDNPELYTVAVNSLLWTTGMSTLSDYVCDPNLKIIETDDFGRVLFQYTEDSYGYEIAFSALMIAQYSTEDYVYFYEDVNFVCKQIVPKSNVIPEFSVQEINDLKEKNDWNNEMCLEKCVKKQISNSRNKTVEHEEKLDEVFSCYEGYHNNFTHFLTADNYGRFICYGVITIKESEGYSTKCVVVLFEEDLSYSILEPSSIYNYQDELKEFKKQNNWNKNFS